MVGKRQRGAGCCCSEKQHRHLQGRTRKVVGAGEDLGALALDLNQHFRSNGRCDSTKGYGACGAVSAARTHEAMVAVLVDDVVAERTVEFGSEDRRP